jgi:hypothetical protein
MRYRNLLKEVQQLSWNIAQLEKKYPIAEAEEIGYENLIEVYKEYFTKINRIQEDFENELEKE